MSQYRTVRYCDYVLFGVEEFVNNEWRYAYRVRSRPPDMLDYSDLTFETVEECRHAIEKFKARDARLAKKEADRIIE